MRSSLPFRYATAALFVAVYIAIGFAFQLHARAYLLVGIPITILFQLVIAKQPLLKLWMKNEEKFKMNSTAWFVTVSLMIVPVYKVIDLSTQDNLNLITLGYYFAALLGTIPAGFAFSHLTKKTIKDLFVCLGIVFILKGIVFIIILMKGEQFELITAITSLLIYIPIAFVVEEVVFRGMLDTYLQTSQKLNGIWSVLFVSVLWALWHLPLIQSDENIVLICFSAIMRTAFWGIPLSLFWRRSGNLAVPVFSHALIDAIRDALSK